MNTVSYEQLSTVSRQVTELVPGYYIEQMDPLEALQTGQGNCFTSAMIAGAIIVKEYGVEPSVAWSQRLHGTPKPDPFGLRKQPKLGIGHIELVVPRGVDKHDILGLGFGLDVRGGHVFLKEDGAGQVSNYNYLHLSPDDTDISHRDPSIEPVLWADDEGEILVTPSGEAQGLVAMDWQMGAAEYLSAVNQLEFDFEELQAKVACYLTCLEDAGIICD